MGLGAPLLGILVACAGFALTSGATWARLVAVAVAPCISALINLAFMSAYPHLVASS